MPLARRALLGASALGVLAGCAPAGAVAGATSAAPQGTDAAAARMAQALAATDRAAFRALFTDGLQAQAGVLYDNWGRLASVGLRPDREGLAVTWRAAEAARPVTHRLRVELSAGRVQALQAGPAPAPIWLRHPIDVLRAEGVCVVVSRRWASAAQGWLGSARAAASRLEGAALDPWTAGEHGVLVVQLPADALEFRALAASAGPLDGVGAYTLALEPGEAASVVVHAELAQAWAEEDRVGVLTHEGVHALTGSPTSPAPLWLVEGLAESVATETWPAQQARNAALVRAELAASAPDALPTADDLLRAGEAASASYALAEVAVEAAMARWGRARTLGWIARWPADAPPTSEFTRTYLAALARP